MLVLTSKIVVTLQLIVYRKEKIKRIENGFRV